MWSHERQAKIIEAIGRDGKVYTNALAEDFDVSRETIRRDLMELEEAGSLERVHGGAVRIQRDILPEARFSDRLTAHAEAKRMIGHKACELIAPSSTLFIDAGTTTLAFARELPRIPDLRIITNSIEIAQILGGTDRCETLLLGGRPHNEVPATYGELTLSEIDRFLADYAVISPVALHPLRGATDYELHEAEVARKMMRRSQINMMLCHAEKVGSESRVAICRLDEIDHLVTDATLDPNFALPRGKIHLARPYHQTPAANI